VWKLHIGRAKLKWRRARAASAASGPDQIKADSLRCRSWGYGSPARWVRYAIFKELEPGQCLPHAGRPQDRKRYMRTRKFGALQCLISLRQTPFWFLGRDRGRINNGSAYRLLFLHSHARASRNTRLSAPEHHRYVRVLDWKVARGSGERVYCGVSVACKCRQEKTLRIILKLCERLIIPLQLRYNEIAALSPQSRGSRSPRLRRFVNGMHTAIARR
jgi:hypothetical protein